jgi:hypothetical protein
MCKRAAFHAILFSCGIFAGSLPGNTLAADWAGQPRLLEGPEVGRGFNTTVRHKRIAALDHLAHAYAAVQSCAEIQIDHGNITTLFGGDGIGALSPRELSFVGGRISDYKESLRRQADEEVCEWAYENFGPRGFRQPGLVRATRSPPGHMRPDPDSTSALSSSGPRRVPAN